VFAAGSRMAPSKEFLWPESTDAYCGLSLRRVSRLSTLNDAPPNQVRRMMRHKHYGTMEHYVWEAQQILEGGEGTSAQI
jgi:hypothetical protein